MTQNNQLVGRISEPPSANFQFSKEAQEGKPRKQFFFEKKNQKTFANWLRAPSDSFALLTRVRFNTKTTKITKNTKFFPAPNHPGSPQQRNIMPAAPFFLRRDLRVLCGLRVRFFLSGQLRTSRSAFPSLFIFLVCTNAAMVHAQSRPNEALVTIESHGRFTFDVRPVANLFELAEIFSASGGPDPQPRLKVNLNDNTGFNEINKVMDLATGYRFGQSMAVIRLTTPPSKP